MFKSRLEFIRFLSFCMAFILIAATVMTISVYAEDITEETSSYYAEEAVNESPDHIFYDGDTLNAIKGWGRRTDISVVQDDFGFSALRMTVSGSGEDPYCTFYIPDEVSTEEYPFIAYLIKKKTTEIRLQTFYKTKSAANFTEKQSIKANYKPNDKWQIVVFELSELGLDGALEQFRIDYHPGNESAVGEYCELAGVAFGKTEDDAIRPICDLLAQNDSVVYHFSEFSDGDREYLFEWAANTDYDLKNGNIIYSYESFGQSSGNDSMAMWNFEEYLEHLGEEPLDAEDFSVMIIKFKAHVVYSVKQRFEIFYQTNGRENAIAQCSAHTEYSANDEWQGLSLDFSYGPEWTGRVHSLRVDWSDSVPSGTKAFMKISDIFLFNDVKSAAIFNKIINNITVVRVNADPDITEEGTWQPEAPWGSETIGFITDEEPSEEDTEETTEETLPAFIETTEEVTEATEDSSTGESVVEASDETKTDTEKNEDTSVEHKPIEVPDDVDNVEEDGSKMPFYIACVVLTLLSIASIATVIVVRAKNKQ